MRAISSRQQNRAAQNQRLKRTLLFVSAAAVLAWLPYVIVENLLNVYEIFPAWQVYYTTIFLQYSNSFVNLLIYTFKIPEFRQSTIMWCLTRRAINGVDTKNKKGICYYVHPPRAILLDFLRLFRASYALKSCEDGF